MCHRDLSIGKPLSTVKGSSFIITSANSREQSSTHSEERVSGVDGREVESRPSVSMMKSNARKRSPTPKTKRRAVSGLGDAFLCTATTPRPALNDTGKTIRHTSNIDSLSPSLSSSRADCRDVRIQLSPTPLKNSTNKHLSPAAVTTYPPKSESTFSPKPRIRTDVNIDTSSMSLPIAQGAASPQKSETQSGRRAPFEFSFTPVKMYSQATSTALKPKIDVAFQPLLSNDVLSNTPSSPVQTPKNESSSLNSTNKSTGIPTIASTHTSHTSVPSTPVSRRKEKATSLGGAFSSVVKPISTKQRLYTHSTDPVTPSSATTKRSKPKGTTLSVAFSNTQVAPTHNLVRIDRGSKRQSSVSDAKTCGPALMCRSYRQADSPMQDQFSLASRNASRSSKRSPSQSQSQSQYELESQSDSQSESQTDTQPLSPDPSEESQYSKTSSTMASGNYWSDCAADDTESDGDSERGVKRIQSSQPEARENFERPKGKTVSPAHRIHVSSQARPDSKRRKTTPRCKRSDVNATSANEEECQTVSPVVTVTRASKSGSYTHRTSNLKYQNTSAVVRSPAPKDGHRDTSVSPITTSSSTAASASPSIDIQCSPVRRLQDAFSATAITGRLTGVVGVSGHESKTNRTNESSINSELTKARVGGDRRTTSLGHGGEQSLHSTNLNTSSGHLFADMRTIVNTSGNTKNTIHTPSPKQTLATTETSTSIPTHALRKCATSPISLSSNLYSINRKRKVEAAASPNFSSARSSSHVSPRRTVVRTPTLSSAPTTIIRKATSMSSLLSLTPSVGKSTDESQPTLARKQSTRRILGSKALELLGKDSNKSRSSVASSRKGKNTTPSPTNSQSRGAWLENDSFEATEAGSGLGLYDEARYLVDGLQPNNSFSVRCSSANSLAEHCAVHEFRLHVRAHDIVPQIVKAVADLAHASHSVLTVCVAHVLLVLSVDRMTADFRGVGLALLLKWVRDIGKDGWKYSNHLNQAEEASTSQNNTKDNARFLKRVARELRVTGYQHCVDNNDQPSLTMLVLHTLCSLTKLLNGFSDQLIQKQRLSDIAAIFASAVDKLTQTDSQCDSSNEMAIQTTEVCLQIFENTTFMNANSLTTINVPFILQLTMNLIKVLSHVCRNATSAWSATSPSPMDSLKLVTGCVRVLMNLTHIQTVRRFIGSARSIQSYSGVQNGHAIDDDHTLTGMPGAYTNNSTNTSSNDNTDRVKYIDGLATLVACALTLPPVLSRSCAQLSHSDTLEKDIHSQIDISQNDKSACTSSKESNMNTKLHVKNRKVHDVKPKKTTVVQSDIFNFNDTQSSLHTESSGSKDMIASSSDGSVIKCGVSQNETGSSTAGEHTSDNLFTSAMATQNQESIEYDLFVHAFGLLGNMLECEVQSRTVVCEMKVTLSDGSMVLFIERVADQFQLWANEAEQSLSLIKSAARDLPVDGRVRESEMLLQRRQTELRTLMAYAALVVAWTVRENDKNKQRAVVAFESHTRPTISVIMLVDRLRDFIKLQQMMGMPQTEEDKKSHETALATLVAMSEGYH
eukprot:CFRG0920T1